MTRRILPLLFLSLAGCFSGAPAPDVTNEAFAGWETPNVVGGEGEAVAPAEADDVRAAPVPVATRGLAYERGPAHTLSRTVDMSGALHEASGGAAALALRQRTQHAAAAAPELARSQGRDVQLTSAKKTTKPSRNLSIATRASGNGLSKNQIRDVVFSSMGQVKACYERALKSDPTLAGRIVVNWSISTTGTVSRASVRSDEMGDEGLQACLVQTIKTWAFPTATASTPVSFPFTLRPG